MVKARSVYFLRHGTRQDFVSTSFVSPTERDNDPPLSASGFKQSDALAHALKNETNIKYIFCSPFSRCIQTVLPTARELGLSIRIEPGLGEWFKKDTDTETDAPTLEESARALNLRISKELEGGCLDGTYSQIYPFAGTKETPSELHSRFNDAVQEILCHIESEERSVGFVDGVAGDVLFVTHAAGVIAGVRGLLNWKRAPVIAGVCSFAKVVGVANNGDNTKLDWKVVTNGECGHLVDHGGLLYNWTFSGEFAPDSPPEAIFEGPRQQNR